MLYTPHFLTGAAIARVMPHPALFIPAGIASHILLDLTPHHDLDIEPGVTMRSLWNLPKAKKRALGMVVGTDLCLMCLASFWLILTFHDWTLLAGGLAGIFLDVMEQGLMIFGKALPGWFNGLQWRVSAKYGFISYPIVSLIALSFLR